MAAWNDEIVNLKDRVMILDVDGVLNGHEWCLGRPGPRINQSNAEVLQHVVAVSLPFDVILCSAWRGMLDTVNLAAVNWMFHSHGIYINVVGRTSADFEGDDNADKGVARAKQINQWLEFHGEPTQWCVIDDMSLPGVDPAKHLRTRHDRGLQWHDVRWISRQFAA